MCFVYPTDQSTRLFFFFSSRRRHTRFDCDWSSDVCSSDLEHHFLEEYSHSPAPEVFLGAASQRTRNIRLGHGIVQLTTNPPQRVAERIACLDLVSNGRVEMGTGESASITELGGFGRDMETKREIWEDAIRCIMPMFQDRGVELDTKWHKMPMRNVLPKPVQKPHPPLDRKSVV